MIKISALNEESEENSDSEDGITNEAQEQIALQQYAKALEHQRKGDFEKALELLQDLLETELLDEIQKSTTDKSKQPLLNLKYLCHKNIAVIQSNIGEIDAAIESYHAAAELDNTDVTLWYKLGLLCCKGNKFEMALQSFQRGTDCNPKHWPCIDRIVTLLLGLSQFEDCIVAIYDALSLDPGYLRGLAYRKHIYTGLPYIRDFMEYMNPKYSWSEIEEHFDEGKANQLILEAEKIRELYREQVASEKLPFALPELKLQKPITQLNWCAVGESLIQMHEYMTEHCYSHAAPLEIIYKKELDDPVMEKDINISEAMECTEDNVKDIEISEGNVTELLDKEKQNGQEEQSQSEQEITPEDSPDAKDKSPNEQIDKQKSDSEEMKENSAKEDDKDITTEVEKMECDEIPANEVQETTQSNETKEQKKSGRRRGSDLSFLQQWEWCKKRRSGRKKPVVNTKDNVNCTIYDVLRKMVPRALAPSTIKKDDNGREISPDTTGLDKLFDEKSDSVVKEGSKYFGTAKEEEDVTLFIKKYAEAKNDIIDILHEFLKIMSEKWDTKWPCNLPKIFVKVNNLYNTHVEIPSYVDDENSDEFTNRILVNILAEELHVNSLLNDSECAKGYYDLSVVQTLSHLVMENPHVLSISCMELVLRCHWVRLHIHILNKDNELALDCLYKLLYEFEGMGDEINSYSLCVPNFTLKHTINQHEILDYMKFLERNKQLSTVPDIYELGNYEQVISILTDSFDYCKKIDKAQEEEMSLDFSLQMCLILESYWALGKVNACFKWSLITLHEALKHFFRFTSGCDDYEKWSKVVVKILCTIEHIFITEGLSCIDSVSQEDLSQGIEDFIRIIGYQVETTATDMPLDVVSPWIIMHYILQWEEDQGRGRTINDEDAEEIPDPLMVLFIGHEQLGSRFWCSKNDYKLLYFILDTVVPRLRLPLLAKSLENILQHMEKCVYCLFGHPGKRNKLKYLEDHNVTPVSLNWARAQQVYEIFRPLDLPELQGKVTAISADTEQLFQRIIAQLPEEYDLQKYVPDLEKYMIGKENKLPSILNPLPYKMRDIYLLIGDYYFKKEDPKQAIKYNMMDILLNNKRFQSWAYVTLAKGIIFERQLNSCDTITNETEFLKTGKTIIRCYKHSLELEFNCELATEYGVFVYYIHSFCSRLLKQASESLSMEDFEALEKQKDEMLDTTQKCFATLAEELKHCQDPDRIHESMWLTYYMLGKVAEKRGKPPSVFLDSYKIAVQKLHEAEAIYPSKINYSSPQNYAFEVLEMHYRIHASILKYIEQHENKPIPSSVGKIFLTCIEDWKTGPFSKKEKKNNADDQDKTQLNITEEPNVMSQAANILKRSISDAGDDQENQDAKKVKLEAAKVRRSASYDTERLNSKENVKNAEINMPKDDKAQSTLNGDVIKFQDKPIMDVQVKMSLDPIQELPATLKNCPVGDNKEPTDPVTEKKDDTSSSSSDSSSSDSSSDSTSHSSKDSGKSGSSSKSIPEKNLTDTETMVIVNHCIDALEECVTRFPLHYKALYRLAHYHFYYKKGKNIERCRDIMLSNFQSRSNIKIGGLFGERKTTNFFNNIWRIPVNEIDRPGGFVYHMNRCILITQEILKEIDDHKSLLDIGLQLQRVPDPDKRYLRDSDREELAQQSFSLCLQSLKGQLLKFGQQADLKTNEVERKAFNSLMLDIYRAYQRAQKQPISKQFTNLLVDGYKLITSVPLTDNINLVDLSMKYCQSVKQQLNMPNIERSQNAAKKPSAKTVTVETSKAVTTTTQSVTTTKVPPTTTSASSQPTVPKMNPQDITNALQSYLPMLNSPLSQQAAAALSLSYLSNFSAFAGYSALQSTLQSTLQNSLQNSFQAEFYRQFLTQSLNSYNLQPPKKQQKRASNKVPTAKSGCSSLPNAQVPNTKPTTSKPLVPPSTSITSFSQLPTGTFSKAGAKTPYSFSGLTSLAQSHGLQTSKSSAKTTSSTSKTTSTTSMSLPMQSAASKSFGGLSSHGPTKPSPLSALQMTSSSLLPMGTVLQTLPPSLSATLTSSYSQSRPQTSHTFTSQSIPTSTTAMQHSNQTSPSKTLQEKLAERQKQMPSVIKPPAALSTVKDTPRFPSSLSITKTSKQLDKKTEVKKQSEPHKPKRKPFLSVSEVIVLDDDDDA